ncbi:MAG: mandelate racemase/muconate lactonizing enzyme family protein [Candidatus Latescibacteria bacterium]|nr:mandelate racemase/muconate lactonizing enzyme family protein [Candidatus Latescibacterota bacterium]
MKITAVETFVVDGGLRPWTYVAIRTDAGLTGYGEFGEGFPRGMVGLIQDLAPLLIGKDPGPVEKLYMDMYRMGRAVPGGPLGHAIAGLELALWDIKGKRHGVPVHSLVGGPFRDRQLVYFSHLATYRATNADILGVKPLRTMDDVADCAREAVDLGYKVFKTNIVFPGDPSRAITQGRNGPLHDQTAPRELIDHAVRQIAALREAAGPDIGICLDINFHFKTQDAIALARALEPFDLYWLEIDNQDPKALLQLKESTTIPITSGEQLQTMRQYQPYFDLRAMDTVKVDAQWQGFAAAKKVCDLAETYELNVAPHNFNGHLSTFQSLHLTAAVSNVRIMESDPDSCPWRDELFTVIPQPKDSYIDIPSAPGWGTDLVEEAARKYAWQG